MRVRKVTLDEKNIIYLNKMELMCYPEIKSGHLYPYQKDSAEWWFAYNNEGKPKGFAGAKFWEPDNYVCLCLAGVVPDARGKGIQKKLIRARVNWARNIESKGVYTYTSRWNYASANNLMQCGFKLFEPSYRWGLKDGLYWYVDFKENEKK